MLSLTGMCPWLLRRVFLHQGQSVLVSTPRLWQTHHFGPGHHLALETGGHWPAGPEG